MTNRHDYTKEQLDVIHKVTLFKYDPSDLSNLITQAEYNLLDSFLQGYAYQLQAAHPHSQIPQYKPKNILFWEGMQQAKHEVGCSILKPRQA